MADVLPFPPPVTGERSLPALEFRSSDDYWHDRWVAACRRWEVERDARLRAEAQRDAYFDRLCEHAEAVAEGRLATPGMVWARLALTAFGFLVIGWLLGRMG